MSKYLSMSAVHDVVVPSSAHDTDALERLGRAALRTKSVRAVLEVRFEDRLHNDLRRHLHHPIPHRRYPQRPLPSILLRDVVPPHRLRPILSLSQSPARCCEETPQHLAARCRRDSSRRCRRLPDSPSPASTPLPRRHLGRSGRTTRGNAAPGCAWQPCTACAGVLALCLTSGRLVLIGPCPRAYPHAQARPKQGSFPPTAFWPPPSSVLRAPRTPSRHPPLSHSAYRAGLRPTWAAG